MFSVKQILPELFPNLSYLKKSVLLRQFHITKQLSSRSVRVRFAPSPTGNLHLGSLRTALYNYLFAKSRAGKFVLRIEDTDQARKTQGAVEDLTDVLKWACLHPDEGSGIGGDLGPYTQSERTQIYKEKIQVLLENGTAYRCFCTPKRLDLLRKESLRNRETPKYDGKCRHLTEEEIKENLSKGLEHVVRLKLITLTEPFQDLVYGPIDIDLTQTEGDPILMKTDGFPTYHFANVVDDHLMEITHVLRGVEWQTSTPKHIMLYKAFGWTPPQYAHLPLILNKDGTKLSKRQGDIHVQHFMKHGYFSESLLNYITIPGGGVSRSDNEVLSLEELVQNFNIEHMKRNSGRLDPEHLDRISQKLIQKKITSGKIDELISQLRDCIQRKFTVESSENLHHEALTTEYLEKILRWSQDRIIVVEDLVKSDLEFLWLIPKRIDVADIHIGDFQNALMTCVKHIEDLQNFDLANIKKEMKQASTECGIKLHLYMKFLRICLIGSEEGPPIGEIMTLLGKTKSIQRLEHAMRTLKRNTQTDKCS